MRNLKLILTYVIVCISGISLYGNNNVEVLGKVVSTYKTNAASGFQTSYFGTGSAKNEGKFDGTVKIQWSPGEDFQYQTIRIVGIHKIKDILGKRDRPVNIFLNEGGYLDINNQTRQYLYSPNIHNALETAFIKSPIFTYNALRFTLEHKSNLVVEHINGNLNLKCAANGESFTIVVNGDNFSVINVSWKREGWKNAEIKANINATIASAGIDFNAPDLADYKRVVIPTKGYLVPNWSSEYHSGGKVDSNQFKGNVVVLDFWATWCPPCIRAIPGLVKLDQKFGDSGLQILGMNYFEKRNPAKTMKRLNATYPTVDAERIGKEFGILNWPTTLVVDKKGVVRDMFIGYHGEETDNRLDTLVKQLLSE
ncbi:TlpA family protein disulfide reductase [Muricauda sp. 2012CJ35-5]|uniref:TlpA family protein disulfide reductase n=1 Tax=Flagellimonas spongiicola TaxID=2942208 RepID=A0ABT0PVP6_9FLAO|nr:TlpA disulfide reductase family protein [Allomuricauda spongiicola]MCL6275459.1 TlpA family protein disulfide reductase [Allomuricauda spongiicola]